MTLDDKELKRIVEPPMPKCLTCGQDVEGSPFDRYKSGDHVRHRSRGRGIVHAVQEDGLHIEFEDYPGKVSAIYDRDWFRNNSTLLCHDQPITVTEEDGTTY